MEKFDNNKKKESTMFFCETKIKKKKSGIKAKINKRSNNRA